jgi:hypothetical protein
VVAEFLPSPLHALLSSLPGARKLFLEQEIICTHTSTVNECSASALLSMRIRIHADTDPGQPLLTQKDGFLNEKYTIY